MLRRRRTPLTPRRAAPRPFLAVSLMTCCFVAVCPLLALDGPSWSIELLLPGPPVSAPVVAAGHALRRGANGPWVEREDENGVRGDFRDDVGSGPKADG